MRKSLRNKEDSWTYSVSFRIKNVLGFVTKYHKTQFPMDFKTHLSSYLGGGGRGGNNIPSIERSGIYKDMREKWRY